MPAFSLPPNHPTSLAVILKTYMYVAVLLGLCPKMKSPIIRGILIPSSYEKHNNGGENAAKELAENIFSQAELAEGYRRGLCVYR